VLINQKQKMHNAEHWCRCTNATCIRQPLTEGRFAINSSWQGDPTGTPAELSMLLFCKPHEFLQARPETYCCRRNIEFPKATAVSRPTTFRVKFMVVKAFCLTSWDLLWLFTNVYPITRCSVISDGLFRSVSLYKILPDSDT